LAKRVTQSKRRTPKRKRRNNEEVKREEIKRKEMKWVPHSNVALFATLEWGF
jgi:hypothetical protein